jgi:hypothetical protein
MPTAAPIKMDARGDRVEPLQKGIDRVLGNQRFKWRKVPIDGVAGQATFKAAHMALWLAGASDAQLDKVRKHHRITQRSFDILTGQVEHTTAMKKRAEERKADAKKLRREHKLSIEVATDGTALYVTPSGQQWRVAAWMVGKAVGPDGTRTNWLKKARDKGWSGELYSGFRDPAYSESLCFQICNAPSCSGTCAGRASNHSQTGPPNWGAIDVQDYERFGRICREIGSPLHNALPNDHPHYSATGR